MHWPEHGIYFFFEAEETRTDSGNGPRVVRVESHGRFSLSLRVPDVEVSKCQKLNADKGKLTLSIRQSNQSG
jgi:hypothetical protein